MKRMLGRMLGCLALASLLGTAGCASSGGDAETPAYSQDRMWQVHERAMRDLPGY